VGCLDRLRCGHRAIPPRWELRQQAGKYRRFNGGAWSGPSFYETLYGKYPKIQILTIRELFEGKQPNIPLVDSAAFKKAVKEKVGEQDALPF
jgi:hypothetical protein